MKLPVKKKLIYEERNKTIAFQLQSFHTVLQSEGKEKYSRPSKIPNYYNFLN